MAPHLNRSEFIPSPAEYDFRTTPGIVAGGADDDAMTHNLPTTTVLKRLAARFAVGVCFAIALGVLVAAAAGATRQRAAARAAAVDAAINTTVIEAAPVIDVVPNLTPDTNAELAAAQLPAVQLATNTEIPVNGRELLHDLVGTAERARAGVTPRPAPPAPTVGASLATATVKLPKMIEMEVTAYCACKKCCGPKAQGITASGKRVSHNNGRFVAADRMYKFGTKLVIPGYADGKAVEVLDRGGAIKGNKLDVYFDSHQEARKWGRQKL